MQELYELASSLLSLSFIWFFDDVTVWNWFSMLVESIIWMIAVVTLMISRSFLKFVMFSLHCIIFRSIFHLEHVNKMCLINIWSLLHLHIVVMTLNTHLSCRNWLKSIFLMHNSSAICKEWQRQILMLLMINISNIHLISCFRFASLLADVYS